MDDKETVKETVKATCYGLANFPKQGENGWNVVLLEGGELKDFDFFQIIRANKQLTFGKVLWCWHGVNLKEWGKRWFLVDLSFRQCFSFSPIGPESGDNYLLSEYLPGLIETHTQKHQKAALEKAKRCEAKRKLEENELTLDTVFEQLNQPLPTIPADFTPVMRLQLHKLVVAVLQMLIEAKQGTLTVVKGSDLHFALNQLALAGRVRQIKADSRCVTFQIANKKIVAVLPLSTAGLSKRHLV